MGKFLFGMIFGQEVNLYTTSSISDLPNLKLEDCKVGQSWNVELFTRLVGQQKADELIEQLGSVKPGEDVLLWLPNSDGCFSTQSAWN